MLSVSLNKTFPSFIIISNSCTQIKGKDTIKSSIMLRKYTQDPYYWIDQILTLHTSLGNRFWFWERERNVLFNDALNTFYLRLYGVRHMVKDILIVRKETRCRHIGYSYRLTARVLLYAPSHRQDNTYHGLCYTSRGALAGTLLVLTKLPFQLR